MHKINPTKLGIYRVTITPIEPVPVVENLIKMKLSYPERPFRVTGIVPTRPEALKLTIQVKDEKKNPTPESVASKLETRLGVPRDRISVEQLLVYYVDEKGDSHYE